MSGRQKSFSVVRSESRAPDITVRRGRRLVKKHVGTDTPMPLMAFRRSMGQSLRHVVELNHRSEAHVLVVVYDPRPENNSINLYGPPELVKAALKSNLKDQIAAEDPPKKKLKPTLCVPVFKPSTDDDIHEILASKQDELLITQLWYKEMQRCTYPLNFFKGKANDSWVPREQLQFWPSDVKIHTTHEVDFGLKTDGTKFDNITDTVVYLLRYLRQYYLNVVLKSLGLSMETYGVGGFSFADAIDVRGIDANINEKDRIARDLCARKLCQWILHPGGEEFGGSVIGGMKSLDDANSDIDVCGMEETPTVASFVEVGSERNMSSPDIPDEKISADFLLSVGKDVQDIKTGIPRISDDLHNVPTTSAGTSSSSSMQPIDTLVESGRIAPDNPHTRARLTISNIDDAPQLVRERPPPRGVPPKAHTIRNPVIPPNMGSSSEIIINGKRVIIRRIPRDQFHQNLSDSENGTKVLKMGNLHRNYVGAAQMGNLEIRHQPHVIGQTKFSRMDVFSSAEPLRKLPRLRLPIAEDEYIGESGHYSQSYADQEQEVYEQIHQRVPHNEVYHEGEVVEETVIDSSHNELDERILE